MRFRPWRTASDGRAASAMFAAGLLAAMLFAVPVAAQTYRVANDAMARTVVVENGRITGSVTENLRTGALTNLPGHEFAMTVVTPEVRITPLPSNVVRLDVQNSVVDSVHQHAADLTLFLSSERAPFLFELIYTASPKHPVVHKTLRWRQSDGAVDMPWFVEELWLEDALPDAASMTGGGYGQPVFTDDLFWGIEYPASVAAVEEGRLRLSYDIGRNAEASWHESYPSVVGAGDAGLVRHDFIRYVNALRPNPVEPYLLYNSWYDIRDFNYPEFFDRLDFFEQFARHYGEDLDAFVLDDGWDDLEGRLWDVDRNKLPDELTPVGDRLRRMDSALGLWISPWGGYDLALRKRAELAREQGFEHTGDYLDLGGPRYFNHFLGTMLDYQQRFNIGFWKIDGFLSTSNRPDNGHLIGRFSRRVLMDRFLDVMEALREDRPDVRLQITVGTWQSPWWLKWADYIWMGGADYAFTEDVPSITRRDQSLTYRDQVMYDGIVTDGYVMPGSAFMTHGIIKGRLNMLGGENEPAEAFLKDAVMYFSRGVAMWELYLTPDRVSEEEWEGLVQIWRWARDRWPTLQHTVYVGGAPRRGEVYGYAHFDDRHGLLTVRNPSGENRTFTMNIDDVIGKIDRTAEWRVLQAFPQQIGREGLLRFGDAFRAELAPYEVAVYEFVTELPDAFATGVPYRIVADGTDKELQLLVGAGDTFDIHLGPGIAADLPAGGTNSDTPSMSRTSFELSWMPDGEDLRGVLSMDIDPSLREPEVVLLVRTNVVRDLELLDAAGKPLAGRQDGDGTWWWFSVPVAQGRSVAELFLKDGATFDGGVEVFLTARPERTLVRVPLRGPVRIPATTLPYEWDHQREIYRLSESLPFP
jgi:hypothetical protein